MLLPEHKAGCRCCGCHANMTAMAEPLGVLRVLQIDHELSVPAGAPVSAQLQLCCANIMHSSVCLSSFVDNL